MVSFIDAQRDVYGGIDLRAADRPSAYYEHKVRDADPERLPSRVWRDREFSAAGGIFAIPRSDTCADGILIRGESVDVPFTVCFRGRVDSDSLSMC